MTPSQKRDYRFSATFNGKRHATRKANHRPRPVVSQKQPQPAAQTGFLPAGSLPSSERFRPAPPESAVIMDKGLEQLAEEEFLYGDEDSWSQPQTPDQAPAETSIFLDFPNPQNELLTPTTMDFQVHIVRETNRVKNFVAVVLFKAQYLDGERIRAACTCKACPRLGSLYRVLGIGKIQEPVSQAPPLLQCPHIEQAVSNVLHQNGHFSSEYRLSELEALMLQLCSQKSTLPTRVFISAKSHPKFGQPVVVIPETGHIYPLWKRERTWLCPECEKTLRLPCTHLREAHSSISLYLQDYSKVLNLTPAGASAEDSDNTASQQILDWAAQVESSFNH
jgi:hypothetical protein